MTELIESPLSSQPMMAVGMLLFSRSASKLISRKKPVGQHYQALDAAVEQHLEIALEAAALVVYVGKNRQVGGLVESILDPSQHQRAVRIGHVKHHDANGVAAVCCAASGQNWVGTISKFFGGTLDTLLGDRRYKRASGSVIPATIETVVEESRPPSPHHES